ncbi:ATP-binding protein [Kitasatospora sp. NPDC085464]|uniref:ATP-binding protein n=1 Tax=Kitasatospora sp. NPDC085464 TaxID=3364063 RepID=UPI0037CC76CD
MRALRPSADIGTRRTIMLSVGLTTAVKHKAVGAARHQMVLELRRAGLHLEEDEADTVQLLLSELLTNAIEHGFGGETEDPDAKLKVKAELRSDTGRLRISVTDPAPDVPPKARDAGPDSTTGRGLLLINLYAADSGYEALADEKTTWFEVALSLAQDRPDDETADSGPLTSTEQQRQQAAQRVAVLDAYRRVKEERPAPWIGTIGTRRRGVIGDDGAAA